MSQGTTQISANISKNTKERMERYAREYGVKKAFLIESALQHHLNVLDEVPSDVVIPPSILLTRESGDKVLDAIENPPSPTVALNEILADSK